MDQQRYAPGMFGRGFPFAPHASSLHSTNHSRGNIMHDHSRLSGPGTAAFLPGERQAPVHAARLFAEAAHVHERVNRRYYERLLMAVESQAAALGLAFTRIPGAKPARLSSKDTAALEQALLKAKHLWCYGLVPARRRHLNVAREADDGGGFYWLQWILDALAERGVMLTRADATVPTCAPSLGVVGP